MDDQTRRGGRRQWLIGVVPVVLLAGGGVAWGISGEYDELPPCTALPAPAVDAGTGVQAAAGAGEGRPAFTTVVTAGPLLAAAYLTDDRPNTTGYVPTADRRGYRLPGPEPVTAVVPAPDGSRVAVLPDVAIAPTDHPGGPVPGRRIGLYDVSSATLSWTALPDNAVTAAWSPDGTRLAVAVGAVRVPAPGPARIVLLDTRSAAQPTMAPSIDGNVLNGPVTALNWQRDGTGLLVSTPAGTSTHDLNGAGRPVTGLELVPGAVSPDGRRGLAADGTVVDLATGAVQPAPALRPCQDHGIDRSFAAVGWYDDTRLLATQADVEFPLDQRRGEPRRPANGMRLVVTDTAGRVSRVVVGWGPELPAMSFVRPAVAPPT